MRSVLFDVLEINIVATLIILLLCLLTGKLRRSYGALWLKIMWLVLIVRMLIPYNFSLPTTEFRFFNVPGFEQEVNADGTGNIVMQEPAINDDGVSNVGNNEQAANVAESGNIGHSGQAANMANHGQEALALDNSLSGNSNTNILQETAAEQIGLDGMPTSGVTQLGVDAARSDTFRYTDILLYIWLIGIALTGLYHLVIYILLRQNYIKGLQPVRNEHLQAQIASLQIKYLGEVKLIVYESHTVDSPLLTGLLHPKLIIPAKKSGWKTEVFESVIAHELCHYRMKDLWLKQLMLAVTCVNWFNPAVYMMKKHFYHDMELVCDDFAMQGRNNEEKEAYARILIDFAAKNGKNYTFMSGLATGKKLTKNRIQHIWEDGRKKKGVAVFICIMVALLGISLFVSCGYKPGEVNGEVAPENNSAVEGQDIPGNSQGGDVADANVNNGNSDNTVATEFSYNNEYNKMVRVYNGKTYVARVDGIYVAEGGELECIYSDDYNWHRDIDIYGDALYFAGSVPNTEEGRSTIYRMDLNTFEVKDVLASIEEAFYGFYTITVYEDNLYAANVDGYVGFALDADGMAVRKLDETADDFIYGEYNELLALELARHNVPYGSAEEEVIVEEWKQSYYPIIDSIACAEMLDGKYLVKKYKDEAISSIYLADGEGGYTFLADYGYAYPVLADKTGIYYTPDLMGDSIYFTDYASGESRCVFEIPGDWEDVYLATHDENYLYFNADTVSIKINDEYKTKKYIMRVHKEGGTYEVLYEVQEENNAHIAGHCGIDEEYLYFCDEYDGWKMIPLQPIEVNISEEQTGVDSYAFTQAEIDVTPHLTTPSFEEVKESGAMWEIDGVLPGGSFGTWYIAEIDGVEYFYGHYTDDPEHVNSLYNYAIVGEQYSLENGIKVGMTEEEILAQYPNMAKVDFEGNLVISVGPVMGWNGSTYPHSLIDTDIDYEYYNDEDYRWTDQFDYAIVGDVDPERWEDSLPVYLALLIKDKKVEAISFYYPTAG